MGAEWAVAASWGDAESFHRRPIPDQPVRTIWVHQVERSALVLGSAQKEDTLDLAAAAHEGLEVCRRHSGGGAVLLHPEDTWIDVIIPAGDPLWQSDVGHAFLWIGQAWRETLDDLGVGEPVVHNGPMLNGELGRIACFAGLGPGEIMADGADPIGAKAVGLSQRRTKHAARFQTMVPARSRLDQLSSYVVDDDASARIAMIEVGVDVDRRLLTDRFIDQLHRFSGETS